MRSKVLVVLLLCAIIAATNADQLNPSSSPPKVQASKYGIVSGLSSGAFAAVQYHVAFSGSLLGAGVIAGGPFYCAQNSETTALTACMSDPFLISVPALVTAAQTCVSYKQCDDTKNLANQTVWLFSGSKDTVVNSGVVKAAVTFYDAFNTHVVDYIDVLPAVHSWVTKDYGNLCGDFASPYMINCDYSASHAFLEAILGSVNAPGTATTSSLHAVSQATYLPAGISPSSVSLGPNAFVYIPTSCTTAAGKCKVVIALHGCEMTLTDIGYDFELHTGLNELAETNDLIVLYPQAIRSELVDDSGVKLPPLNPEGCWDWWGYSGPNYSNREGPQMAMINNMFNALVNGTLA